jgi:hypothetical protein
MKWIDALRIFNKDKGAWCIPRKGSDDYQTVRKIMSSDPAKEEKTKEARAKALEGLRKVEAETQARNKTKAARATALEGLRKVEAETQARNKRKKALEGLRKVEQETQQRNLVRKTKPKVPKPKEYKSLSQGKPIILREHYKGEKITHYDVYDFSDTTRSKIIGRVAYDKETGKPKPHTFTRYSDN